MCNSELRITLSAGDSVREVINLLKSQAAIVELDMSDGFEIDIDEVAFQHGYIVVHRSDIVVLELA